MGALDDWQLHYEELNQPKKAYPAVDIGLRRIYAVRDFIHGIISYAIRQIAMVLGSRRLR